MVKSEKPRTVNTPLQNQKEGKLFSFLKSVLLIILRNKLIQQSKEKNGNDDRRKIRNQELKSKRESK